MCHFFERCSEMWRLLERYWRTEIPPVYYHGFASPRGLWEFRLGTSEAIGGSRVHAVVWASCIDDHSHVIRRDSVGKM